ncbi:3394_t:CDS:1, partial [Racocetra persica]
PNGSRKIGLACKKPKNRTTTPASSLSVVLAPNNKLQPAATASFIWSNIINSAAF